MTHSAGLVLVLLTSAAATEIHVDQQHAAASDQNSGTRIKPLATISAAVERVGAGDTVLVHEGVYREEVVLEADGTSWANAVRLLAADGDEVTIKGSDVVTGWTVHEGAVWKKQDWAYNSQMVFADGRPLQQIAGTMISSLMGTSRWLGRVGEGMGDMMPGSFYYDQATRTLYLWAPGGADPNGMTIEVAVRPHMLRAGGRFFEIRGLRMTHSNSSAEINWPGVMLNGEHYAFRDNRITWCDFIGLSVTGEDVEVTGNEVSYCGNIGISGRSYGNVRLNGNQTHHNNWRRWSTSWQAGGIKIIPTARGLTIENHKAFHNLGDGIWIDAFDTSNVVIRACEVAYNQGAGIHYETAQLATIANNIAHHNHSRGIYLSNSSDSLIAHNVCYKNAMSGIVVLGSLRKGPEEWVGPNGIVPARNNRVIGNILVENLNPRLMPQEWNGRWRPELILPNPDNGTELFGGCSSDYNIFYRGGERFPFWFNFGDQSWSSLEQWSDHTGNDAHSLQVDPLFVNPDQGDFRLRAGSPAIDLVPWLAEVPDDYDDQTRSTVQGVMRTAGSFLFEKLP